MLRGAFEGNATAQAAIDRALAAAPDLDSDENAPTAFVQALKVLPSATATSPDRKWCTRS